MGNWLYSASRWSLIRTGTLMSSRSIAWLDHVTDYLEAGRWMRARGFDNSPKVNTRTELWDMVGCAVGELKVLYLEFGVFRGDSMRYWCSLLRNPAASLHGFDTFEGLPETWRPWMPKGALSVGGQLPQLADPRVRFFKGLFQETLPHYEPPEHDVLVVNIDCDIYSGAAYVLKSLRHLFKPGTYLYLDDLVDRHNVMKAFDEFMQDPAVFVKPIGYSLGSALLQVEVAQEFALSPERMAS